jgi:small GTP-binding protein
MSRELEGHRGNVLCLAWTPDGRHLASGSDDRTVRVWNIDKLCEVCVLQGHTDAVIALDFSHDGTHLVSKSRDGSTVVRRVSDWNPVVVIKADTIPSRLLLGGAAFHPATMTLAVVGDDDRRINIWDLNESALSTSPSSSDSVQYVTASVALVGETGAGKTGLAGRLLTGKFDASWSSHGLECNTFAALSHTRDDGTVCEAILWDFAGQPDYRLVQAIYLDHIHIAVIVFDASNHNSPLMSVDYWLNQLQYGDNSNVRALLVGARIDRGTPTMTRDALDKYCEAKHIPGGYVPTSARTSENIDQLLERLRALVPWDSLPSTITTKAFKQIKDFVIALKATELSAVALIEVGELQSLILAATKSDYSTDELTTAVGHLANHGHVKFLRDSSGGLKILLRPDLLGTVASTFVLEARRSENGLGVIDERRLLSGKYQMSELATLADGEAAILVDCVTTLFLRHNLCFRQVIDEAAFFVFPSLINEMRPRLESIETDEGASYIVSGNLEHLYASMVVLLGYTDVFARVNQWQNQAQYELGKGEVCGFRHIARHAAESEYVLYFEKNVGAPVRILFQDLFEKFLRRDNVKVVRIPVVSCGHCRARVLREVVADCIMQNSGSVFCGKCGTRILMPGLGSGTAVGDKAAFVDDAFRTAERRTTYETSLVQLKRIAREMNCKAVRCFLSYPWGNEETEKWVENLARELRNAEIAVIYDRWSHEPGETITRFVEEIAHCGAILVVSTPEMRTKYDDDSKDAVIRMELDLIHNCVMRRNAFGGVVVPLLCRGTAEESLTPILHTLSCVDFTTRAEYFRRLFDLLIKLYGVPFDHPGIDLARRQLRITS